MIAMKYTLSSLLMEEENDESYSGWPWING